MSTFKTLNNEINNLHRQLSSLFPKHSSNVLELRKLMRKKSEKGIANDFLNLLDWFLWLWLIGAIIATTKIRVVWVLLRKVIIPSEVRRFIPGDRVQVWRHSRCLIKVRMWCLSSEMQIKVCCNSQSYYLLKVRVCLQARFSIVRWDSSRGFLSTWNLGKEWTTLWIDRAAISRYSVRLDYCWSSSLLPFATLY